GRAKIQTISVTNTYTFSDLKGTNMRHKTLNHFLATIAIAALTAVAVLGLAGPAAAKDQVPFKGRIQGVVTVAPIAFPIVSVLVNGTGNATHLGHFTFA